MVFNGRNVFVLGLLTATLALPISAVSAQDQQPPAGRRGGGGGFGFFGGRGAQPPTLATVPIATLESALKLTPEQKTQITAIQEKMPRGFGGRPGGGGPGGGPPDREAIQKAMEERQKQEQALAKEIDALLTPAQKAAVPALLKDVQTLNSVGLPSQLLGTLGLTAEQKTKLAEIGTKSQEALQKAMQSAQQSGDFQGIRDVMMANRQKTQEYVNTVLTDAQKAQVEKYRRDNPQRGPGGGRRGGGGAGGGGAI